MFNSLLRSKLHKTGFVGVDNIE